MDKTPLWKVHAAQVIVQLGGAGYYVLAKAALSSGVNSLVFPVYQKLISTCVLVFISLFARKVDKGLTRNVFFLIFLAAFSGVYVAQISFLTGLQLTSGSFAAAMQNAVPVFAFMIAVICRLEEVHWMRRDGQAKLLGVFCCVAGALFMTFYQGPVVIGTLAAVELEPANDTFGLYTSQVLHFSSNTLGLTSWQFGSLCLLVNSLCAAIFINLQAAIVARYPAPVPVVAMVTGFGVTMLGLSGIFTVKDSSDWIITKPGDIIALFYCGALTSALGFALSTWCVQKGGPFLATAYIPSQAVFSAIFGLIFLGEVVYLGSVVGALFILIGLFSVTWGQQRQRTLARLNIPKISNATFPDDLGKVVVTNEEDLTKPLLS